jgi:serine/threonine protein kinase
MFSGESNLYLIYSYYPRSVRDLIHNADSVPLPQAQHIAFRLAHALRALHSQKIVHGDLKISNVLFSGDGTVKIAGFGHVRPKITSYSAPEIAATGPTPATDIWSYGVILYQMITETLLLDEGPKFSPRFEGYEDQRFRSLITKLLDPDPQRRPRPEDIITDDCFSDYDPSHVRLDAVPQHGEEVRDAELPDEWREARAGGSAAEATVLRAFTGPLVPQILDRAERPVEDPAKLD